VPSLSAAYVFRILTLNEWQKPQCGRSNVTSAISLGGVRQRFGFRRRFTFEGPPVVAIAFTRFGRTHASESLKIALDASDGKTGSNIDPDHLTRSWNEIIAIRRSSHVKAEPFRRFTCEGPPVRRQ
jgi:hypothetical protein